MAESKASLKRKGSEYSDVAFQLNVLNGKDKVEDQFTPFSEKLKSNNLFPLTANTIETLQVNVGYMCNQVCSHCHVDAGPDRKEIMTKETMDLILTAVDNSNVKVVDLTGGAPEMNPDFRYFVEELAKRVDKIIVRCNLTIIVANKKYNDLPEFFKNNKVEVVSSLPYFSEKKTDAQRGDGVFDQSIKALKMLNAVGFGMPGSDLTLNLVYNPSGAFLPPAQEALEQQFKKKLKQGWDIEFNTLFAITNIPISRYLEYLIDSGNYTEYMEKLVNQYNPVAAENVMCRSTVSVSWDGYLYDCDFNQMLDLKISKQHGQHISEFNKSSLESRNIIVNQHCYGCTAGSGSSCGGEVAN